MVKGEDFLRTDRRVLVRFSKTGKTFTMFGKKGVPGLIQLLIEEVNRLKPAEAKTHFSMFQIYNESVFDLLQRAEEPLQVKEDAEKNACVPGLANFEIFSAEDAFFLLTKGDKARIVRETEMNAASSRSHTIALLEYSKPDANISARLVLCDLAGSERMHDLINPKDKRFTEMKYINLSLTALGKTS